jgi:hypothetical protein
MRRLFRGWTVVLALACLLAAPAMAVPALPDSPSTGWQQVVQVASAWWAGLVAAVDSHSGTQGTTTAGGTTTGGTSTNGADGDHGPILDPNG